MSLEPLSPTSVNLQIKGVILFINWCNTSNCWLGGRFRSFPGLTLYSDTMFCLTYGQIKETFVFAVTFVNTPFPA
jgi:hypothetical protein